MKLTKKILAVLASAIMMAGSVSSVSAAYGVCPYDVVSADASLGFKDRPVFNDNSRKKFVVKATDGTALTENRLEFRDEYNDNLIVAYEYGLKFIDSERYFERQLYLVYRTEFTGTKTSATRTIGNTWSGDIYEVPETLRLEQRLPNGLEGNVSGTALVWDYKTAR